MQIRPIHLLAAALAVPALAHSGGDHVHGFAAGFAHPLLGWDHLLAMFAVGVWSAQHGGRRVWLLPAAFVAAMALGGALGMAGYAAGFTETAIALSVLALGLAVALAWRLPTGPGLAVCAAAAVVHGMAHGAELPADGSRWGYAAGFLLATAGLHLAGIGFGRLDPAHGRWQRGFGMVAAAAGGWLLLG
ncbi:HupE/UreJ family protein [Chitinimonas koreensis]|uniref:HupE/UreJ family protein n=1 Tax=Chitinimonas koreensis TaxID=356302 RepID=UPI0004254B46|nr:HupE/UreJ family protein [Chitinimonas koreensis]QNM96350.1 HupE/UreJ family protein [Chitinimonas koreensis]